MARHQSVKRTPSDRLLIHLEYQIDLFSSLPGVEIPEDSGAGKPGVYWYPTFSAS